MFKVLIKNDIVRDGPEYIPLDIDSDGGLIITANEPLQFKFALSFKTYNINILNTPKNNLLLKNLFNKNIQRPVEFSDVYLIIDNIYFKSILYINSFNNKSAKGQLVSSAGYIWFFIQNKNLRDFDWSEYDHQLNSTNVRDNDLFDGDIKYDFIYRGKGLYENDDRLYPSVGYMRNVDICERRPAIRLKSVLNKIFEEYDVIQNVWSESLYDRLYLTPVDQNLIMSDEWYDSSYVFNYIDQDGEDPGEVDIVYTGLTTISSANRYYFKEWWDTEDGVDGLYTGNTFTYVASETASYRFSGKIKGSYNISYTSVTNWKDRQIGAVLRKYNSSSGFTNFYINDFQDLDDISVGTLISENFEITFDSKIIYLEAGEYITLEVYYQNVEYDSLGDIIDNPQDQYIYGTIIEDSFFKISPFNYKGYGANIEGNDILPDIKVNDFMTALLTNFNIEFYYNFETKKVYLQNRYIFKPPVYDISNLIIYDSYEVDLKRPPLNYYFNYAIDSNDSFYKNEIELKNRDDGNKLIDNGEDPEIVNIGPSFSFNMMMSNPNIISMHNDDDIYSTSFNLRLMIYNKQLGHSYNLHSANNNGIVYSEDYIPQFTNYYSGETLSYNSDNNYIGIYDKYFKDNMSRLLEGNVVEVDILVDELLLSNLYFLNGKDLRAVFFINTPGIQGYYQLVSLDKKNDYIYKAKLFRDSNYNYDIETPTLLSFNNDFSQDFN